LIVISTLTDFVVGRRLYGESRALTRKGWLLVSLVVNLGVLGFFKYWDFFVDSAATLLLAVGAEPNVPLLRVVLPVGISFYTFQTLSYTIDIYRRRIEPEPSLTRFALFVAFFPQLVAGPIERASHLLPQLRKLPARAGDVAWREGLTLIGRGLFRKVVIADGVAPVVNQVFGTPDRFGGVTIAVGVVAFSLQIYGDFAGYTDIARGTAKLFGVDLMENFRAPYFSRGFSEFWQRWHISLSTWLRDYLYIPLGGNRGSKWATYRNLMITMLLGGLWHGAGWGFVLWGGLHGLYLSIERLTRTRRREKSEPKDLKLTATLFVFVVVTLTWIPFRSPNLADAINIMTGLLRPFEGQQLTFAPVAVAVLGLVTIAIDRAILNDQVDPLSHLRPFIRGFGYGSAIVAAVLFASQTAVPFIYFQF
jgi:D-alanyl-lipoteichoic acid acyltransferase DltB (MBOAT superfamily)